ncbi:MAG: adenylyltransferase/cytidyltransferase family protein [Candidatus Paceibacterota bacterium]|jgi:cytidyltransferase-like protein
MKKVLVSGCFDLLHSGHIQFFKEASYFELYVSIGSDKNVLKLKDRHPLNSEQERLFMVKAIRYVKEAFVSTEMGILDFKKTLKKIKPDYFVVNADGDSLPKRRLVEKSGVKYIVLSRQPAQGLEARSTTKLKKLVAIPNRIDLAGGWLDQPFVSKHYPGAVITFPIFGVPLDLRGKPLNINKTVDFNLRSGMATSTRKKAIDLWGNHINKGDPIKLAKILFAHENPPGTIEVAGSQDSIGIVVPGITNSWYEGKYWPEKIESLHQETSIKFLENHLFLLPLDPRHGDFRVLEKTQITKRKAKNLSLATTKVWQAIKNKNLKMLASGVTESFRAQVAMFPLMTSREIEEFIKKALRKNPGNILGYKLSGAGGGGYLICVAQKPVEGSIGIKIMREIIRD